MATTTTTSPTTFTYTLDGKSWELPLIGNLRPALLQQFEDEAKPLTALKGVLNEVAPGLFNALPNAAAIEDLMNQWQAATGVTVGESSASADS